MDKLGLNDAYIQIDENSDINYISDMAADLFGWNKEKVIKESFFKIFNVKKTIFSDLNSFSEQKIQLNSNNHFYSIIVNPLAQGYLINFSTNEHEKLLFPPIKRSLNTPEKQLRFIIDNMNDAVGLMDGDGILLFSSSSIESNIGFKPEQVNGYLGFEGIHPEDIEKVKAVFNRSKITLTPGTVEYRALNASGEYIWIECSGKPVTDNNGNYGFSIFSARNVTKRKIAEKALEDSERSLLAFINSISDAIFMIDLEGNVIITNEALPHRFGMNVQDILNKNLFSLISEDLTLTRKAYLQEVAETGKSIIFEDYRDGNYFKNHIYPVINSKGKFDRFVIFSRDITNIKKAQLDLEESKERYRTLTLTSPDAVFILTDKGMVFSNPSGLKLLKANNFDELKDIGFEDIIPQPYLDKIKNRFSKARNNLEKNEPIEIQIKDFEGNLIDVETASVPIVYEKKPAVQVVIRDITHRKEAEAQILLQNRILESINTIFEEALNCDSEQELALKTLQVCEEITNSKFGLIMEINAQGTLDTLAMTNSGWDKCQMGDDAHLQMNNMKIHGLHGEVFIQNSSILTNTSSKNPASIGVPDGHPEIKNFLGVPLREGGSITGIIGLANKEGEYTETDKIMLEKLSIAIEESLMRYRAEESLKAALKDKELLLKEIHHRVKNNLMVISSLLNLQSMYIKDPEARDVFKESQSRAKSMALIHERLYSSVDLKRIDFADYCKALINDLYNTYVSKDNHIEINLEIEPLLIDINTAIPLGLIITELLTNSMKHAFQDEGGLITVKLSNSEDEIILVIEDNGVGFPEDLDYLNNDSLGLEIVQSLIRQIEGNIELKTKLGTCFTIRFPESTYEIT